MDLLVSRSPVKDTPHPYPHPFDRALGAHRTWINQVLSVPLSRAGCDSGLSGVVPEGDMGEGRYLLGK